MSGNRSLDDVYRAASAGEAAALYDGWAAAYEADMARAGYRHPAVATALLARHLPRGSGPVLDAGAGTGLAGQWLPMLGLGPADALDISAGMLAFARARGTYRLVVQAALGGPLPFADAAYQGIIAAGVFTTGHVGAEALPELCRVLRPGGVMVLTVKTTLWTGGFEAALTAMPLALAERTEPYVSMPGEAGTVPSLAVVLRRL